MELTPGALAAMIDYAVLKPDATGEDIERACNTARTYGFASLCVAPCNVAKAVDMLKDTGIKVSTVVGFPLGSNTTEVKVVEALKACRDGALQLHVVINIGALKSGDYGFVEKELREVVDATKKFAAQIVVIIEAGALSDEEKKKACETAERAGAQVVKNATGFGPVGARAEDIKLMRASVSPFVLVKAAGGIKSLEYALAMIEAGANIIGTSAGPAIIDELRQKGKVVVNALGE
jgi:deoxyribose-phosphate aldolase